MDGWGLTGMLILALQAQDRVVDRSCHWFQAAPTRVGSAPRVSDPAGVTRGLLVTKLFDGQGIVFPGIQVVVEPMPGPPGFLRVQAEGRLFRDVAREDVLPWTADAALGWVVSAMDNTEWTPEVRFQAAESVLEAFGDHPLRRKARLKQAQVAVLLEEASDRARAREVLQRVLRVHGRSPEAPELRWLLLQLSTEPGLVPEQAGAVEPVLQAYEALPKAALQGVAVECLLERKAVLHGLAWASLGGRNPDQEESATARQHREAAEALYARLTKSKDGARAMRASQAGAALRQARTPVVSQPVAP